MEDSDTPKVERHDSYDMTVSRASTEPGHFCQIYSRITVAVIFQGPFFRVTDLGNVSGCIAFFDHLSFAMILPCFMYATSSHTFMYMYVMCIDILRCPL
jgi:hypothetical protein